MADTLKQLGREIGRYQRSVESAKRRGGALPRVERTRGYLRATTALIVPFTVDRNNSQKVSLSIHFTDSL